MISTGLAGEGGAGSQTVGTMMEDNPPLASFRIRDDQLRPPVGPASQRSVPLACYLRAVANSEPPFSVGAGARGLAHERIHWLAGITCGEKACCVGLEGGVA